MDNAPKQQIMPKEIEEFSEAIKWNKPDIVDQMVQQYGREIVNIRLAGEQTPLIFAAGWANRWNGFLYNRDVLKIIACLLDNGADINARDNRGDTALLAACKGDLTDWDVVKLLLSRNPDLDVQNVFGRTALMEAMWCPDSVQLLLEKGADLDIATPHGDTLEKIARRCECWSALKLAGEARQKREHTAAEKRQEEAEKRMQAEVVTHAQANIKQLQPHTTKITLKKP